MNKILPSILAVMLLFGCTTSQKLQKFSKNSLVFGSGGGITGATTEYILHYDGTVEKTNSLTKETSPVTKIAAKNSKTLFKEFLNDGLDTLKFSSPGNMSYFVGYKNDSVTQKILWGGDVAPPEKAKTFYDKLIQIINNL